MGTGDRRSVMKIDGGSMTKADEDAIHEIELRFNEAWGRHDADGMVESLADDAQFVTVNGAWTKTRADYLNLLRRLHGDRKSTRLNSSHLGISYAVFCLKKK